MAGMNDDVGLGDRAPEGLAEGACLIVLGELLVLRGDPPAWILRIKMLFSK
jgi:hypothetical protein